MRYVFADCLLDTRLYTLAHAAALQARMGLDTIHSQMRTLYTLTQRRWPDRSAAAQVEKIGNR
jgi:hypothetical protein